MRRPDQEKVYLIQKLANATLSDTQLSKIKKAHRIDKKQKLFSLQGLKFESTTHHIDNSSLVTTFRTSTQTTVSPDIINRTKFNGYQKLNEKVLYKTDNHYITETAIEINKKHIDKSNKIEHIKSFTLILSIYPISTQTLVSDINKITGPHASSYYIKTEQIR